jgi:hypothetical protein
VTREERLAIQRAAAELDAMRGEAWALIQSLYQVTIDPPGEPVHSACPAVPPPM